MDPIWGGAELERDLEELGGNPHQILRCPDHREHWPQIFLQGLSSGHSLSLAHVIPHMCIYSSSESFLSEVEAVVATALACSFLLFGKLSTCLYQFSEQPLLASR